MPYCHKRYYIAKGKCASVTEIIHLCLWLLCLSWVQAYVCALHAARDNRCAYYIVVMLTIPLQLSWCCLYITIPLPSCCAYIIVSFNRCTSYYAHISNVRQVFSVSILSFLQYLVYFGIILIAKSYVAFSTIVSRSYRAWRRASCVSYYNIIYVLFPYYSAKTQSVRKLALKIGQKSSLLYVVFITSLGCSSLSITRHKKYTAFCGVYVLSLLSPHFCASTRWERLSRALRALFLALAVLSACCIDRNNVARLNKGRHLHYQARLQRCIFEHAAGCVTFYNIFSVGDLEVEILR